MRVSYGIKGFGNSLSYMIITRTKTGAAKYDSDRISETELNMEQWLVFINALRKCNIDEWEEYYRGRSLDGWQWTLKVFFLNKDRLKFAGSNARPPNWDIFEKAMNYL
jgi:hypothetical protein